MTFQISATRYALITKKRIKIGSATHKKLIRDGVLKEDDIVWLVQYMPSYAGHARDWGELEVAIFQSKEDALTSIKDKLRGNLDDASLDTFIEKLSKEGATPGFHYAKIQGYEATLTRQIVNRKPIYF